MRNYSRILTLGLVILFATSLVFSFYKFYIVRDYMVYGHTECDPSENTCFVYECDVASEDCTGDPEEDTEYYALIQKNASQIPTCDPHKEECEPLACASDEADCEVTFCDERAAAKEEVECSNPEDFQEEELEEEGMESEEDASENEESEETEEGNEPAIIESGKPGLTEEPLEIPGESLEVPALPKDKALE
ncbi:MAG: hypothetical protein KIH67_003715 [Candidatus Moranbacteria bacterium]|nr:hypothetical protein [Candidatus Moranbacteria bacterium]